MPVETQRSGTPKPDTEIEQARAREIAAKYGETKVLLSFGAAGGGALLAQWLRLELLKRRGYALPNEVYLDTIALAYLADTQFKMRDLIVSATGVATAGGLASLNDGWSGYYRHAMTTAHTMIFVLTKNWFASPNCREEHDWYIEENATRAREGRETLFGIGLVFPFDGQFQTPGGLQVIEVKRRYAVADEKKRRKLTGNYRDFWILEDTAMRRLMPLIRPDR